MSRPAKLQINQDGTWRDALSFDIDQLVSDAAFLEATDKMMNSIHCELCMMRIVATKHSMHIDANLPIFGILAIWDENGWRAEGITPASTA